MSKLRWLIMSFLVFSGGLFASDQERSASAIPPNARRVSSTEMPSVGVNDGKRKPPKRVFFSDERIEASKKIKYLIVLLQENWSFDSLYGFFPGAHGIKHSTRKQRQQIDLNGIPFTNSVPVINLATGQPYPQIPTYLPNGPFDLQPYLPIDGLTGNLNHDFYYEQYQINGGQMNSFATYSTAGGLAMSYYDIINTRMGELTKQYVLCDNWFHSCYGGSMCGVLWLFAGRMPVWPNAPQSVVVQITPGNVDVVPGLVSLDGYAINDAQPFFKPYLAGVPAELRVPPQHYKTIGDRLSAKGVSWKWYAQGWDAALAGHPAPTFAFHHQAPVYFPQYAPGTKGRAEHLFDLDNFYADLAKNQVPEVSFIRTLDEFSEHPGKGSLLEGLNFTVDIVEAIQASPIWEECAIIIAYDENGGRWDHVSPPVVDRFGPGARVPAIIISPFAKKGHVDHTCYETVSILKFIEDRWGLRPLSSRDAAANNILKAFDFDQE